MSGQGPSFGGSGNQFGGGFGTPQMPGMGGGQQMAPQGGGIVSGSPVQMGGGLQGFNPGQGQLPSLNQGGGFGSIGNQSQWGPSAGMPAPRPGMTGPVNGGINPLQSGALQQGPKPGLTPGGGWKGGPQSPMSQGAWGGASIPLHQMNQGNMNPNMFRQ